MPADIFGGMRVIESRHLTHSEARVLQRSWRERLWSWPWRPWVSVKTVVVQVPNREAWVMNLKTIVVHPDVWKQMREAADARS